MATDDPAHARATAPRTRRPLMAAGLMLGVGMGGFVDGIVLHQLLQVHSMLSARRPRDSVVNLQINMFWDGLFHAFTWLATAVGIAMLFRVARRADAAWSGRTLLGSMLMGWGLFNVVEGLIDHFILHVHHVYERAGFSMWDWLFLGSGLLLLLVGYLIAHTGIDAPAAVSTAPP